MGSSNSTPQRNELNPGRKRFLSKYRRQPVEQESSPRDSHSNHYSKSENYCESSYREGPFQYNHQISCVNDIAYSNNTTSIHENKSNIENYNEEHVIYKCNDHMSCNTFSEQNIELYREPMFKSHGYDILHSRRRYSLCDGNEYYYKKFQKNQESIEQCKRSQVRCMSLNDVSERVQDYYSTVNYPNDDVTFQNNVIDAKCGQMTYQHSYHRSDSERNVQISLLNQSFTDKSFNDNYSKEGSIEVFYDRPQGSSRYYPRNKYDEDYYKEPQMKHRQSSHCAHTISYCATDVNIEQYSPVEKSNSIATVCTESQNNNKSVIGDILNRESLTTFTSFDVLDILSFPSEWSSCFVDKTGYVDISLSSSEGKSVKTFFQRTSQSKDFLLQMTGITRVENPFLHTLYLLKKEEMISRNGHVDELFLYHGTKKEHVSQICEDNLNWRMFSENHRFGQGVSFSPLATYSSHYSDKSNVKVMLLFKVLVSNAIIGSPDMVVPTDLNGVTCDTSIKDDATVIVKYADNEFYPLYKIMYKTL